MQSLQELMRQQLYKSFSTIEEIQLEFRAIRTQSVLSLAEIQSEPTLIGLLLKDLEDAAVPENKDLEPLCVLIRKADLELFARFVLGLDPPVEQQILTELRSLRAAVESSQQQS